MSKSSFSASQITSFDIAARVSACLSLAGTCFTLISYSAYPPLRKPFNRLAFCIAIANAFACLAYSWGIHPIHHGRATAFCQTQGFFIEWFVMTDPLLVLVMAVSVWLRIQARRSPDEIRVLENVGVSCAFTLPLIPAVVFLCWRPHGLTVYGPAVLWCWISAESNVLKLAAFYGPIWCMILGSILLFVLSGRRILQIRAKVNEAQGDPRQEQRDRKASVPTISQFSWKPAANNAGTDTNLHSNTSNSVPLTCDEEHALEAVSDDGGQASELELPARSGPAKSSEATMPRPSFDSGTAFAGNTLRRRSTRFEAMHWKYARFAILCTLVLFVTWIPISVNRIYNNFIRADRPIYGLYLASALCIPLHGFGNFIIYLNTSWAECRAWSVSLLPTSFRKQKQRQVGQGARSVTTADHSP